MDTVNALSLQYYKTRSGHTCRTLKNVCHAKLKKVQCVFITNAGKNGDVFFVNPDGSHMHGNKDYDLVQVLTIKDLMNQDIVPTKDYRKMTSCQQ